MASRKASRYSLLLQLQFRCVRSLLSILVEVWAQSKVLGDRLKYVLSLFLAPELIKVHKYCLAAIAAPMKFEESP